MTDSYSVSEFIRNTGILVVEDDEFQRDVILEMLCRLGGKILFSASTGLEALKKLKHEDGNSIKIVICDLNMPEMDGMEFLRHIGSSSSSPSVILMSALDEVLVDSVKRMAVAYGLDLLGSLAKPVGIHDLAEKISRFRSAEITSEFRQWVSPTFSVDEILAGIDRQEFLPFFQPKIELSTGKLAGAEALARWSHPQHGIVSPAAFIPPLESAGNIDSLTFLMLCQSSVACRLLLDSGFDIPISINLSLSSLTDTSLADRITEITRMAGISPRHIILEVTESATMTDVAPALENLARLRMRGFGLSIDDYGTGYSNMQQISRIAFTELKIDQSFVREIADHEILQIIVNSNIQMACKLGMKTTAEGVENERDMNALLSLGCDIAQGYHFAKPMCFESFQDYCDNSR